MRLESFSAPVLAALVLGACGQVQNDVAARMSALADAYVQNYFETFPNDATALGVPDAPHHRMNDNSLATLSSWHEKEEGWLAELRQVNPSLLEGRPEAVTYGFLLNLLESSIAFRECRMELWNVSPTWTGWPSQLAQLANLQPVETEALRQSALSRYSEVPRYLDTEIGNLREGIRLGYTAPRNNARAVLEQINALLDSPISESPFVQMATDEMPEFRSELETLVASEIRPAVTRYRDFIRDEYLASAREAIGVDANPGGSECYLAAIRYYSTVDISPQEVHETGLREMEIILSQMREIGERSFGTTEVFELLESLRSDPDYLFRSRSEMIAYAEGAVERARMEIPEWFGLVPEASVVVEPVPEFQEKSAPGGFYNPPAEDGSRPGIYMINTYQADLESKAGVEATAFHETYPGHHLQGSIALEREGLHPISRYFYLSGFGEGWALYSERLGEEMGLYTSDVDRMGLLSNEALRAARLVVDAGMHALGWTRQQALDYLVTHTAESRARAEAEIDRYIAVPGQATSYMLGNLEIRLLRELAERELGGDFDVRSFHDRILEDGSVPLTMLREKIERWVSRTR